MVHYINLLEQIQAVQKGDIVYDAGGVQGEKRRGAKVFLERHVPTLDYGF